MIKKLIMLFFFSIIITILVPLITYRELTLLHFINTTFFIGGFFLFISLLTITVKSGFFDVVTYGFRRMFVSKGKELTKQEALEIPAMSKLVTFDHAILLYNGLALLCIMLIALGIYYN
ncbi:DUF3899 domain-containing protein [Metabacillus malikii]|uniref:DUF3899 domain-containing protein n=1 Tax=Metabacillus malikii TaxID=1504265 RepID=A0ABT9ZFM4_9BACI|nr:DUF3899 domain-containing protein [Metabacillus malikii]MDQ0230601.1 hypothetical protein [Metabacillus malikii]